MKYKIVSESESPYVLAQLNAGEKIKIERGAMIFHSENIELEGKTGGLGKALSRSFVGGESIFMTTVHATADNQVIAFAPKGLGTVHKLNISPESNWYLKDGLYLGSDETVNYSVAMQKKLTGAVFGGTGGLFILKTEGQGDMFIEAFGSIKEIELDGSQPIIIDTDHAVAWQDTLNYDVQTASGLMGFKTGEGLVIKFTGKGKILIQSRNVKTFASLILPYVSRR